MKRRDSIEELEFHPSASIFPLLEGQEFDEFVEDIRENGLHNPITVFDDQGSEHHGKVLDGRNRVRACQVLGITPFIRHWRGTPEEAVAYVVSENLRRRHLNESQRAMVAAKLANMRSGERTDLASIEARSQSDAAEMLNVSRSAVQRAGQVQSKGTAELAAKVEAGELAVSTAADIATLPGAEQDELIARGEREILEKAKEIRAKRAQAKRQHKQALADKIRDEPPPLPEGPFRVIVIDPPWRYDTRVDDDTHRSRCLYPDMSVEEICALPVMDLAHEDCVLWLWTTNAFTHEAHHCLDAWGFTQKTILTWNKVHLGTGNWLRNTTEHCLLGVRGKPLVELTNQTTILEEKRREHSRKPEAFYKLVEDLCPGPKLEMFAREKREGWSSWGAEVEKFAERAVI